MICSLIIAVIIEINLSLEFKLKILDFTSMQFVKIRFPLDKYLPWQQHPTSFTDTAATAHFYIPTLDFESTIISLTLEVSKLDHDFYWMLV